MFKKDFYLIPENTLERFIDHAHRGENVTTLWLPGIGRSVTANKFQQKIDINKTLGSNVLEDSIFIHLDMGLSDNFFYLQLGEMLEIYSKKDGIRNKIIDICKSHRLIFIMDNFTFKNLDQINYLYSLSTVAYKKINYWIFSLESEFYTRKYEYQRDTMMSHNIIKVKYLDDELSKNWLKINFKLAKTAVPDEKSLYSIIKFAGGVPAVLRVFVRKLSHDSSTPLKTIEKSEEMYNIVENIWRRFSESEKEIIRKVQNKEKLPQDKFILYYLKEQNFISKNNSIRGKWIDLIVEPPKELEITLQGEKIVFKGFEINGEFTSTELDVLRELLDQTGETVSRDQISDIIWEDPKDHSDWALDQTISRIRKKLDKVRIGREVLVTVKNKGYRCEKVKVVSS